MSDQDKPSVQAEEAAPAHPAATADATIAAPAVPMEENAGSGIDPRPSAAAEPVDLEPVKRALMDMAAQRPAAAPMQLPAVTPVPVAPATPVGVLLINLGTPERADAPAIRAYLKEFLNDPRVIEKRGPLWRFVLNGIILPLRPRFKVKAYRTIWNQEADESPLKTITRAQAERLAQVLGKGDSVKVDWAMRYGFPRIAERLSELAKQGCERILLMPLYPQYSSSSTATACDAAFDALARMRWQPAVRVLPAYYADAAYIEAVAQSVERHVATLDGAPEVILASYHGMPEEYVRKGDPYEHHCNETTRLLRARLGRDETKLIMTFQSRFGRDKWLGPATADTVKRLAKDGVKSLAVVTPGFAADCLETLEEIAIEIAALFRKHGGERLTMVPCLNDDDLGMDMLRQIATRELQGWI